MIVYDGLTRTRADLYIDGVSGGLNVLGRLAASWLSIPYPTDLSLSTASHHSIGN
jgi:hypothetical protein